MAISKEQKKKNISIFSKLLKENKYLIVWKYHGITSLEMASLRMEIKSNDSLNLVFKNRLAKICLEKDNKKDASDSLIGPNSFLFTNDEDLKPLKIVNKLVAEKKLEYAFGYLDGEFKTAAEIKEIASLPSRKELIQKLAFLMKFPITKMALALKEVEKSKK